MTNVKVTLTSKKGNDYEALVPITTACKALVHDGSRSSIHKMGYSVVRKCHDYLVSKAENASQRAQLNKDIAPLYFAMSCSKRIALTNCLVLFED